MAFIFFEYKQLIFLSYRKNVVGFMPLENSSSPRVRDGRYKTWSPITINYGRLIEREGESQTYLLSLLVGCRELSIPSNSKDRFVENFLPSTCSITDGMN